MFYFSFFTFVLVALSIIIHGIAINYLAIAKIKSINYLTFAKFSLVLFCSHLAHIFLFAIFYAYSFRHLGPTELFAGNLQDSFVDFFYFSITTYTTLGVGDVYPLGNMRIVAGLQSLVGLVLIAWTATFKLGYLFKIKK